MKLKLTPSYGMVVGEQSIKTKVKAGKRYSFELFIGDNGFNIRKK